MEIHGNELNVKYMTGEQLQHPEPAPWLVHSRLKPGAVTLTAGADPQVNSIYAILESVALASGKLGIPGFTEAPVSVLFISGVWSDTELSARVLAAADLNKLVPADLNLLKLSSVAGDKLPLVYDNAHNAADINAAAVDTLTNLVTETSAQVVVLDCFLSFHLSRETDSRGMQMVINVLKRIAARTSCAISVFHTSASKTRTRFKCSGLPRGTAQMYFGPDIVGLVKLLGRKRCQYARLTTIRSGEYPVPADGRTFRMHSVSTPGSDTVCAMSYSSDQSLTPAAIVLSELIAPLSIGEHETVNKLAVGIADHKKTSKSSTHYRRIMPDLLAQLGLLHSYRFVDLGPKKTAVLKRVS